MKNTNFIKKLTEKDLNSFVKYFFEDYDVVENINKTFIKDNNLKFDYCYNKMPEVFKQYNKHEPHIFCGYRLDKIKQNDEQIMFEFQVIKFGYCSLAQSYLLENSFIVLNANDFECDVFNISSLLAESTSRDWYNFMYEQFGEKYLKALKKYLKQEKQKKLSKHSEKLDAKNIKIVEELTK